MDPSTKRALDALDRVCENPYPISTEIDAEYAELLALVQDLPCNRAGTDKTWVEESYRRWLEHYRSARRIGP